MKPIKYNYLITFFDGIQVKIAGLDIIHAIDQIRNLNHSGVKSIIDTGIAKN